MTRRTRLSLAAACLPLLFSAAACSNADTDDDPDSFSGDGEVPSDSIQSQFEAFLDEAGATEHSDVACDPVQDEVDATSTCTAVVDGVEGTATVTVTASDDTSTTLAFDGSEFGIG